MAFNRLDQAARRAFLEAYDIGGQTMAGDYRGHTEGLGAAKIEVMGWLYGLSEGMWGLTQDHVSSVPFAAGWTGDVASFHEYGLRFLTAADERLREDRGLAASLQLVAAAAARAGGHRLRGEEL